MYRFATNRSRALYCGIYDVILPGVLDIIQEPADCSVPSIFPDLRPLRSNGSWKSVVEFGVSKSDYVTDLGMGRLAGKEALF